MKTLIALIISFISVTAAFGQIRAKQVIEIKITGVPVTEKARVENVYQVSASGTIEMWAIGTVRASGLTGSQLASSIAAKYKAAGIYNSPTFIITSQTEAGDIGVKTFTVGGRVKIPGPKPWSIGMTLYKAVQAAGGEDPFGAVNRVSVFRDGKSQKYNLKIDSHKMIKIYEGDTIDVPEKDWKGQ